MTIYTSTAVPEMHVAAERAQTFIEEHRAIISELKVRISQLVIRGIPLYQTCISIHCCKVVRIVPFPSEPHMGHHQFIETAARAGGLIHTLEKSLMIANFKQREFATFTHTVGLFESLDKLRDDLQALIQHRVNKKFERIKNLQTDVFVSNVSESERHFNAKRRSNKSREMVNNFLV